MIISASEKTYFERLKAKGFYWIIYYIESITPLAFTPQDYMLLFFLH